MLEASAGQAEISLISYQNPYQRLPQNIPKTIQRWPRTTQDSPKMAQDGPKTAQDRPKEGPRRAPDSPRQPQEGPSRPQDSHDGAQDNPKTSQNAQSTNAPRWPILTLLGRARDFNNLMFVCFLGKCGFSWLWKSRWHSRTHLSPSWDDVCPERVPK